MAEVKVLIEGYVTADMGGTCPTISLIKDKGIKMVVDPGVMKSTKILVAALKKEGLSVEQINFVCITHSHMDHYRNLGLFTKAKILDYFGIWEKDKCNDWKEQFTRDIKIIKTPGHNFDALTLLVKTKKGIIAVCGDVFWKENYPKEPKDDLYASDKEKLKESRKKVMEMADFVIPGHGKMFGVEKK